MILLKVSDKETTLIDIPYTLSRWIRRVYCKYQRFFWMQVLSDNDLGMRYDGRCIDIICHSGPPYYLPFYNYKNNNRETKKLFSLLFNRYGVLCTKDDHRC